MKYKEITNKYRKITNRDIDLIKAILKKKRIARLPVKEYLPKIITVELFWSNTCRVADNITGKAFICSRDEFFEKLKQLQIENNWECNFI